jgi:hypothetical protein
VSGFDAEQKPGLRSVPMKLRIAALALAVAFAAAPALGAIARSGCAPCAEPEAGGPCSSLSAMTCCGEVASTAPVKSTLDAPTLHAIAGSGLATWVVAVAVAPRAAHDLAAEISPLRLSVVRRL